MTSNHKRTIRALIQKCHEEKKENINQNLAKIRGYISPEKFCQGADEMKYLAVNFSKVGQSESGRNERTQGMMR